MSTGVIFRKTDFEDLKREDLLLLDYLEAYDTVKKINWEKLWKIL